MAGENKKETLVETWLRSLKNRPTIAVLLLLGALVTGIASFTESVDKLFKFFVVEPKRTETARKSEEDIHLEQTIIGTWKPSSRPPAPTAVVVKDFHFTLLPNGTINWGGSYTYQNHDFPIMMSGKWNIEKGVLNYKVESSNVPFSTKEGFTSGSKILSIISNKLTYVDLVDGKTKVAIRQK